MPLMHQFLMEKADWYESCLSKRAQSLGYGYLSPSMAGLIKNMTVGAPSRIALLAQRLGVTRRRVSQIAGEGVKLGILELVEDADDKRVLLVRMSEAGQQMVDATIASMHRIEAELARRIGRAKLEALMALLAMDWGPAEVSDTPASRPSAEPLSAVRPSRKTAKTAAAAGPRSSSRS